MRASTVGGDGPLQLGPAPAPERVTLVGHHARLEPLAERHAADLYAGSHGPERDALWQYLFNGPFANERAFAADLGAKVASLDPLWFAVIDLVSGRAVGMLSLMRIDRPNRVIEVGGILFTPALQRSAGATEAQYLLARYVFEDLGYRRYEWKCNDLNLPSKRAAMRLGFIFEGRFRQHMIIKGRNRDTAWFAMLDHEWPARRQAFETWLDPANFVDGQQRSALARRSDANGDTNR